jgi:hypothetical protein
MKMSVHPLLHLGRDSFTNTRVQTIELPLLR